MSARPDDNTGFPYTRTGAAGVTFGALAAHLGVRADAQQSSAWRPSIPHPSHQVRLRSALVTIGDFVDDVDDGATVVSADVAEVATIVHPEDGRSSMPVDPIIPYFGGITCHVGAVKQLQHRPRSYSHQCLHTPISAGNSLPILYRSYTRFIPVKDDFHTRTVPVSHMRRRGLWSGRVMSALPPPPQQIIRDGNTTTTDTNTTTTTENVNIAVPR